MFVNESELQALSDRIGKLDTEEVRDSYRSGNFPRADKVKDINVRYRWDLLWAAKASDIVSAIYDRGGNDTHIDTALRKIVGQL